MVPGIFPMIMFMTSTRSPAFNAAKGVAPDTPSRGYRSQAKVVISFGKDRSRKHRPASAGFIKFCPMPPNSILATTMANTAPNAPIHRGALAGRFNASRSPVTTAEKSLMVTFCLQIFSKANSLSTAAAIHTIMCNRARTPKL